MMSIAIAHTGLLDFTSAMPEQSALRLGHSWFSPEL